MTTRLFTLSKANSLNVVALGVASIVALAISARIQIPMLPVPMTMQTALVLLLPFLMGWRFAVVTVMSYIAAGFAGLPVFASGAGPAYLVGPTGGYLLGFVASVYVVGRLFDSLQAKSFFAVLGLMLLGHALILACGAFWLAFGVPAQGVQMALLAGIVPFLSGAVLKSLIGALIIVLPTYRK